MALSDDAKQALDWAMLVPGALRVLGDITETKQLNDAADVLNMLPVGALARELAKARNDRADILSGKGEIRPGIEVVIGDPNT